MNNCATMTPLGVLILMPNDSQKNLKCGHAEEARRPPITEPSAWNLFTPENRRHDLVSAYPELETVCTQLEFGSGMSLREWSATPDWALLVLARAAKPPKPPLTRDMSIAEISEVIDEIISQHHRPLRNELRRLGILIRNQRILHPEGILMSLDSAFTQLEENLLAHLDHVESEVSPQCTFIEGASRGHIAWKQDANDVTHHIHAMMNGHDDGASALANTLSLIEAAMTHFSNPDIEVIRIGIIAIEEDFAQQGAKESDILVPVAIFAEEQLRSRHAFSGASWGNQC